MDLSSLVYRIEQTEDVDLLRLVQDESLSIDTIEALKEFAAQFYVKNPAEALQIARSAYRLGHPLNAIGLGRWILANSLVFCDRYREASELYALARTDYLAENAPLDAARLSIGYVFTLAYTGASEQALALADEIEPLLAQSAETNQEDLDRLALLWLNMGVAYELLGRYEECLDLYARLADHAQEHGDALLLAQALHNQAAAKVHLSALDEALDAYYRAETIFIAEDAPADLARLYTNLLAALAALARNEEMDRVYAKAVDYLDQIPGIEQERHRLQLARALTLLQREGDEDGRDLDPMTFAALVQAREAFSATGARIDEGLAWYASGRHFLARDDSTKAVEAFEQALSLARSGGNRQLLHQALHGLGLAAHAQGDVERAVRLFHEAIEQIESVRSTLNVEFFRAGFLYDKVVVYRDLAALYVAQGALAAAFQVIERAKSRLLAEKLTFRLETEVQRLPTADDAELAALADQLSRSLAELDGHYRNARVEALAEETLPDMADQEAAANEVAVLERSVQSLVRRIQRRHPTFAPLENVDVVDVAVVASQLGGHLFVQYFIDRDRFYALLVDSSGMRGCVPLAKVAQVRDALDALSISLDQPLDLAAQYGHQRLRRYLPALLRTTQEHLSALYGQLFAPLQQFVVDGQPLIFVPDDLLYSVPFHALYNGESYLIERHAVSYTPSATVRTLCVGHSVDRGQALLVGYDDEERLGEVAGEIRAVESLLRQVQAEDFRIALGQDAVTALFDVDDGSDGSNQYRFIHIAAHASFRRDDPMLSAILLADRGLTLAEVASKRLRAELVVLSGCETGAGLSHGADLVSLASGFLGAGAQSLLVGLWRIHDQVTGHLMPLFYDGWLAGRSRADALRSAQLTLLEAADHDPALAHYGHPAFWAPFILIGE